MFNQKRWKQMTIMRKNGTHLNHQFKGTDCIRRGIYDLSKVLTYLSLHNQSDGQCDGWVVRKLGIIWIHLLCTAQRVCML